jgi:hypothetical protein
MPSHILNRQELPEEADQARQPEPAVLNQEMPSSRSPCDGRGRRSELPYHRPFLQPVVAGEPETTGAEPEEVLIADRRGDLAPSLMVERKLMALLGTLLPGVFNQAGYGREDLQKRAGQRTSLFPRYARWQAGIKPAE